MGMICRLAVMGDTTYNDEETIHGILAKATAQIVSNEPSYIDIMMVLGGAKGVDASASRFCTEHYVTKVLYKPYCVLSGGQGDKVGDFKLRRRQMIDNCDILLVIRKAGSDEYNGYIARAVSLGKNVIIEEIRE